MLRTIKKMYTLDLYIDHLLSGFGQVTATDLSSLSDGSPSHDKITRTLSENEFSSKDLWHEVKSLVRGHESEDACLIFDFTNKEGCQRLRTCVT